MKNHNVGGWMGTYNGIDVYGISKEQFLLEVENLNEEALYLVDNKFLVQVKAENAVTIGQLEPNGTVFEYARPEIYIRREKKKKKKAENKYSHKHSKEECPVHIEVEEEYTVEEVTIEDLGKMSAAVDAFLASVLASTVYEDILFKGEV